MPNTKKRSSPLKDNQTRVGVVRADPGFLIENGKLEIENYLQTNKPRFIEQFHF